MEAADLRDDVVVDRVRVGAEVGLTALRGGGALLGEGPQAGPAVPLTAW